MDAVVPAAGAGAIPADRSEVLPPVIPVRRWRVWFVFALAALLVFGHVYDVATLTEHWPFSYYPMYGRAVRRSQLQLLSIYGVMQTGKNRTQLQRITSSEFVPQLGEARLRNILLASWGRPDREPSLKVVEPTASILSDYMKLYESRRIAGLHSGPPMIEAQLCRITWVVRTDHGTQKPRKIEPLLGVRASGKVMRYFRHLEDDSKSPATLPAPGPATQPIDEQSDVAND